MIAILGFPASPDARHRKLDVSIDKKDSPRRRIFALANLSLTKRRHRNRGVVGLRAVEEM